MQQKQNAAEKVKASQRCCLETVVFGLENKNCSLGRKQLGLEVYGPGLEELHADPILTLLVSASNSYFYVVHIVLVLNYFYTQNFIVTLGM